MRQLLLGSLCGVVGSKCLHELRRGHLSRKHGVDELQQLRHRDGTGEHGRINSGKLHKLRHRHLRGIDGGKHVQQLRFWPVSGKYGVVQLLHLLRGQLCRDQVKRMH